jgi:polyhydroxyalkanoate synthesis regulator phasin
MVEESSRIATGLLSSYLKKEDSMADPSIVQQAVNAVNELCAPEKMSKQEAIDFLEDVMSDLQSAVDALQDEIDNESDEGDDKEED